jgi:DNA (cytosine-5)-methyltransferase 1
MSKLRVGSLFSGYGGLDLAVMNVLDAEVVWHCEWDDAPSKILEQHFPGVPNYRDVSKVDWAAVEPVDVLTGGFPCQDLSLAGKRAGLRDGTRSGLWSEFANAIEVLKPRLVVIENVRGLLSATAHSDVEQCAWCMGEAGDGEPVLRALGAVLGDLADLGFDARWTGVRAADAGAPHNRFRVFIVAFPKGLGGRGGALGEAEALRRGNTVGVRDQVMDLVAGQGLKVSRQADNLLPTVTTSEANGAGAHGDGGQDLRTAVSDLLPTPSVAHLRNHDEDIDGYLERRQDFIDGKTLGMPGASLGVAVRMQAEGIDLLPTPQTMDTLPARSGEARERQLRRGGKGSRRAASGNLREDIIELLPTTSARDFKDGQADHERNGKVQTDTVARQIFSGGEITSTAWGKFAPAIERWEQLTGRPAPAPTKPDGKDDAHRLSSEFTEWMMGLPAGWITGVGLSRNEELKACGNGVVPQQAELALRMLLEGLPVEREREL